MNDRPDKLPGGDNNSPYEPMSGADACVVIYILIALYLMFVA